MDQKSENQKTILRKLRFYYSIAVPLILLLSVAAWFLYLNSTMPSRRLLKQLQRAKNLTQIEQIIQKSPVKLDDDKMAEVYIHCALAAFTDKDYAEAAKLLQMVIRSNAHPELKASAQYELASTCFLSGNLQEGFRQLDILLNDPDTPSEIREKALELKQFVKSEIKQ